jgi:hypothetical protein
MASPKPGDVVYVIVDTTDNNEILCDGEYDNIEWWDSRESAEEYCQEHPPSYGWKVVGIRLTLE